MRLQKGAAPKANFIEADIQEINFPAHSFDGVWANASLLHIPKNNLKTVLLKIHSLLKENGIFFMSVKKGTDEIFRQDTRYTEHIIYKFWSFYEPTEITDIIKESGFSVINEDISNSTPPFIRIHSKKTS